jgi:AhpD family alkylhydroperoxidase
VTHLPSLGDEAALLDVFRRFPHTSRPLLDYHQVLLRGPSPLTVAHRELIAAYVSALNACHYCAGIHTATAEAFGVPGDVITALLADVDTLRSRKR